MGLVSAGHPKLLADVPHGGGRTAALLSADGTDCYLTGATAYRVRQKELEMIAVAPWAPASGEGPPCRCGTDGRQAALVSDEAVMVKALH